MADAAENVATDANVRHTHTYSLTLSLSLSLSLTLSLSLSLSQVVDLLIAMCNSAASSGRASKILDPYPSIVDPQNSQVLAMDPSVRPCIILHIVP